MCKLTESNKYRKPKAKTVTAYKVFDDNMHGKPFNFCGDTEFEFGNIVWDKHRAEKDGYAEQLGFQMFAKKKDAIFYAVPGDYVCEVEIQTKNIKRVGHALVGLKAYEVTKFKLTEENWKNRIQDCERE